MADACPNCGVWLGNEPLPNDSAWERQQAEIVRLRAEIDKLAEENYKRYWNIERLRVAGHAMEFMLAFYVKHFSPVGRAQTVKDEALAAVAVWEEACRA